jgi:hypothetical protein
LEDADLALNTLYEGPRPFNVIDLALSELQKTSLNSLKIDTQKWWSSEHYFSNRTENISFANEIKDFLNHLSPDNEQKLIEELSLLISGIISKVMPGFLNLGNDFFVSLSSYPKGYDNRNNEWHVDGDRENPDFKVFLTTLTGPTTLYFVPSPETYLEFYKENELHGVLPTTIEEAKSIEEGITIIDRFFYWLVNFTYDHKLELVNKFSAPQGYATAHVKHAVHRAPDTGPARLLLVCNSFKF